MVREYQTITAGVPWRTSPGSTPGRSPCQALQLLHNIRDKMTEGPPCHNTPSSLPLRYLSLLLINREEGHYLQVLQQLQQQLSLYPHQVFPHHISRKHPLQMIQKELCLLKLLEVPGAIVESFLRSR